MNIPFNPIKSQSNLSNIANCTIVNSLYLGGAVGFLNGHNYGHNLHKLGYGPLELSLYIVIHLLVKLHPQAQSIIIPKRFNGRNMARVCAFDVIRSSDFLAQNGPGWHVKTCDVSGWIMAIELYN